MRAHELALATIDALHVLGWDYLLVGGQAAIQHGITRTTYDVDIVLKDAEDAKHILAVQGNALVPAAWDARAARQAPQRNSA